MNGASWRGVLCGLLVATTSTAQEAAEGPDKNEAERILEMRNTVENLIDALVTQGVFSREQADNMVRQAERKARLETLEQTQAAAEQPAENVVRVPYVPEFVLEDVRNQVRQDLRKDVTEDVAEIAQRERWGTPDALPDWLSHLTWGGDIRVRHDSSFFAKDNTASASATPASFFFFDVIALNAAGGFGPASTNPFNGSLINTTENRNRLRGRGRLVLDIDLTENWSAGFRLATGNLNNLLSTNDTLDTNNNRFGANFDRAFMRYRHFDLDGYNWMTVTAGRFDNPFFSTDLIFDRDLQFEGAAFEFRKPMGTPTSLFDAAMPNGTAFMTLGAFPLEEVELSDADKWMFGGQVGLEYAWKNQTALTVGAAYYDFVNVTGQRNEFLSNAKDFTAPSFAQQGNTLFDIRNDLVANNQLLALLGDYDVLNINAVLDLAQLAPHHVFLTLDFAANVGWDSQEVAERLASQGGSTAFRFGGFDVGEDVTSADNYAFNAGIAVGWPLIDARGKWRVEANYKYLEADAMLDAFTESNFHLGGTNAQGYHLRGFYGFNDYSWLRAQFLSAKEIKGAPYSVGVLLFDINSRF